MSDPRETNRRNDDRLVPEKRNGSFDRAPVRWENDGTYAEPNARLEEHPVCGYQEFPFLVEVEHGLWRTPDGYPDLPLSFTIRARKGPAK